MSDCIRFHPIFQNRKRSFDCALPLPDFLYDPSNHQVCVLAIMTRNVVILRSTGHGFWRSSRWPTLMFGRTRVQPRISVGSALVQDGGLSKQMIVKWIDGKWSFKCQNIFILNREVNVRVGNICLPKNDNAWIHVKIAVLEIVLANDQKHVPGYYFLVRPNASPKRTPNNRAIGRQLKIRSCSLLFWETWIYSCSPFTLEASSFWWMNSF